MKWLNLSFIHWALEPDALRLLLPQGLELDTFEGKAYLGFVPFEMRDVKPRFCPSVPGLSHFAEFNLRTYVSAKGKAGVWFFSLDAANAIAVRLARAFFFLPYFDAQMSCLSLDGQIYYHSKRTHKGAKSANFIGSYKPESEVFLAQEGSVEYFLSERYCLYSSTKDGQLFRGEIHHKPWPLQTASLNLDVNTLAEQIGLTMPHSEPLVHFAKNLDVIAWLPERV